MQRHNIKSLIYLLQITCAKQTQRLQTPSEQYGWNTFNRLLLSSSHASQITSEAWDAFGACLKGQTHNYGLQHCMSRQREREKETKTLPIFLKPADAPHGDCERSSSCLECISRQRLSLLCSSFLVVGVECPEAITGAIPPSLFIRQYAGA